MTATPGEIRRAQHNLDQVLAYKPRDQRETDQQTASAAQVQAWITANTPTLDQARTMHPSNGGEAP